MTLRTVEEISISLCPFPRLPALSRHRHPRRASRRCLFQDGFSNPMAINASLSVPSNRLTGDSSVGQRQVTSSLKDFLPLASYFPTE